MSRFYKILIPTMVAFIALAAGIQYQLYLEKQELMAGKVRPTAPNFTLNSTQGPLELNQFKGKAVVIYFGYASCPDVCPIDLGIVGNSLKQLSAQQRENVAALFITLDPERDSPQRLSEFAQFFDSQVIGLYGTSQQIADVARSYGVIYEKSYVDNDPDVYWVSHSANFFLINPEGQLIATLPRETTAEQLSMRLQGLIN